ncbi:DUF459 domain-containing protein [Enterobacter asburiae]|uniref:SGNH/GDSL hydrolase family protein n=1 Tax=Enterobacter asburiae TaxID=61645 RepID=UPI0021D2609C|nr:DUF459 domain-containing protein [Enterobacter asburiae]MCU6244193.1 DUF459 domain-containing protein [Enterobacter asburiae]
MQISDYIGTLKKALKSTYILLACLGGMIWLNQQSLNQYWALHYHRESPWVALQSSWWKEGETVTDAAAIAEETYLKQLTLKSVVHADAPTRISIPSPASPSVPVKSTAVETLPPAQQVPENERELSRWIAVSQSEWAAPVSDISGAKSATPAPGVSSLYDNQGKAVLPAGKKVLLTGDSMMEGVAPRVLHLLRSNHDTLGLNLSKRSTGLAYPGFFNWPVTIANTLAGDPDIGLLVVFLGPNDPWDMPVARGRSYLKFRSDTWEREYRHRIEQILSLSQKYRIPVIWLLPPNMRKPSLNKNMAWLDTLYTSEVNAARGITINVNTVFGYQGDVFSPTIHLNGKRVHIRANDGIHYSPAGESLIAKAIIDQIHFDPKVVSVPDEE